MSLRKNLIAVPRLNEPGNSARRATPRWILLGIFAPLYLMFLLADFPKQAAAQQAKRTPPTKQVAASSQAKTQKRGAASVPERAARPPIKAEGLKRQDQPGEATDFYRLKRLPTGLTRIPVERYFVARDHIRQMPQYDTARNQAFPSRAQLQQAGEPPLLTGWGALGPGNIGGRTRALLIHPTTPSIMYAGGVAGGVWKTTNSGALWTPLADLMANLAISTLAFDPANPNIIYAGTGEGFFNGDAVRGAGIFKTTDAGANWTQLSNTNTADFHYVNDLIVSPNNSQRLYAATRTGVWRSTDGGTNWTQVFNPSVNGGCLDLAVRTDQATDYVFAACGTFAQSTIYRNTDAGGSGTWDAVYTETGMGRTSLAIAPSNQNVIYALSASVASGTFNNGLLAVFRSTSSGASGSWTAQVRNTSGTKLNTVLLSNPVFAFLADCGFGGSNQFLNQGWYDNVIAVDPVDANRVWAGGIDLFRSDDAGANWGQASHWWAETTNPRFVHADQHSIVFHPQYDGVNNKVMYVGNDGGIFRTDDARAATATGASAPCDINNGSVNWVSLNNSYGVTQFYHGLPYPNGTTYFGGTQDNGTIRGTDASGANAWAMILGGDGGYVAVDPTNTNTLYAENTGISIRKSTNGGTSFSNAISGISDTGLFITPFLMDPNNAQRLWVGGRFMWRTDNAAGVWNRASTQITSNNISAIAVAPGNSNLVLAGASSGRIARTTSAITATSSTVWTNHSTPRGTAGAYISWLAFDPNNTSVAYATVSTFNGSGADVGHVFKSTDGGQTWASIDGSGTTGIPDIPAHCIAVHPSNSNLLYVGTDLGVFVSVDGGLNWSQENTGFANVVVESLAFNTVSGVTTLYAFTHGRGAWKVAANSNPCGYLLSATSASVGAAGTANGSVGVTTTAGCTWTAVSNAGWITINSGTPGNGNGTVGYSVAANSGAARSGTLTIAGITYTINQGAGTSGCTYTLSATSANVAVGGGVGTVNVNASAATCTWTAVSNVPWVTFSYSGSGTGSSVVVYSVAANTGAARSGTLTIAGITYTINQAGGTSGCTFTLSPTSANVAIGGGIGTINVTASTATCAWTAVSNVPWVTLTYSGSGTGSSLVVYSVAANSGAARSGTLTIAGITYTINQAGGATGCTYTLSATSANVAVGGGVGTVNVNASAATCTWTAVSNVPWVTFSYSGSGTGSSVVVYSVAANTGAARSGTLTIAGITYTINQ
jgi:hypothetical protein